MSINKIEILRNICYTELVYGRINKKLNIKFSKEQIEKFIFKILKKLKKSFLLKSEKISIYQTQKTILK